MRSAPDLGVGPSEEQVKSLPFTAAAFVEADPAVEENRGKGCLIKLRYTGGNYSFAAMIMAQAGATLLYDRNLSAGTKGGCLTAGVLGPDFVERAKQGGLEIETTMVESLQRTTCPIFAWPSCMPAVAIIREARVSFNWAC